MFGLDAARLLSSIPQTQPYLGWSLPTILIASVVGATVVTVLGVLEFERRDIY
jgi:hypothetical protein